MRVPMEKFITEIQLVLGLCQNVGQDAYGNYYYKNKYDRRWVIYKGAPEGSKVPSLWNAWLHHTVQGTPVEKRHDWERPHLPNLTGTMYTYKARSTVSGAPTYAPWTPKP